ncbi:MAG: prepilin-type N-terminal cleavage/methylation domain-containing protein [Elusimicrobia bacterium]|nr:prepilin-type N-terminal cleavage/methylation domain-containing protein [Elusimicrobiota bacterium]
MNKNLNRKASSSGFTLLEMTVTVTILLVVIGAVYASFWIGIKTYKKQSEINNVSQNIRIAFHLISRDLRCSFLSMIDDNARFLGGDTRLDFAVFLKDKINDVSYYIDDDLLTPESGLQRRVGGRNSELAPLITAMNLKYYDGKQWLDSWGIDKLGQPIDKFRKIPRAVKVMFTLTESGGREKVFTTVVPVLTNAYNIKVNNYE